jgi:hypothetical protein
MDDMVGIGDGVQYHARTAIYARPLADRTRYTLTFAADALTVASAAKRLFKDGAFSFFQNFYGTVHKYGHPFTLSLPPKKCRTVWKQSSIAVRQSLLFRRIT